MGRKEERNNFNKQTPSWALARKCTHTERGMKEPVTVSGCAHCPSGLPIYLFFEKSVGLVPCIGQVIKAHEGRSSGVRVATFVVN